MKLLFLLPLLMSAAAQTCECDNGFSGASCQLCTYGNVTYTDPNTGSWPGAIIGPFDPRDVWPSCGNWDPETADTTAQLAILIRDFPTLTTLTTDDLGCHGAGSFNPVTQLCTCVNSTIDGTPDGDLTRAYDPDTYCAECAENFINWPACNVRSCAQFDPCNGNGQCDDSAITALKRCGNNVYDPETDSCCSYKNDDGTRQSTPVTKEVGGKCCGNTYCSFGETCQKFTTKVADPNRPGEEIAKNVERYFCADVGAQEELCIRKGFGFGGLYDISASLCEPYETCCAGTCIGSNQDCVELQRGSITFPLYGGGAVTTSARLEWKLASGFEIPEDNRVTNIAAEKMSAPSAVLIVVLPLMLIVAGIVSVGVVLGSAGKGAIKVFVPALLSICLSFFLFFSVYWPFALLAMVGSLTAIGAQAGSSENRFVFSAIFQLFILAVLVGGMGAGSLVIQSGGILPDVSSGSGSNSLNWGVLNNCASYYNYFNTNNIPWDMEDQNQGYCSHGFYSFVMFAAASLIGFYFIQLVASASLMAGEK